MSDSPLLDIVIPVYGGWPYVERCLASLEDLTIAVNVIVVDDLSPDDTLARIRERFDTFTIVANDVNLGFAKSCNVGIAASRAPYVLLLNSDVVAHPAMAEHIVNSFESDGEDVGSIASILLSPDGTVDSYGISADVTLAGFVRFHGADLHNVESDSPTMLGPYGAAAAYRRRALAEVGLLDENIFMYGEELELALRLRAHGWKTVAISSVVGTHIGGASAGRESARQRYLAGFGRAYTLRVYRVLRGPHGLRAAGTEAVVTLARLVLRRDLESIKGRVAGWKAGRGVSPRVPPNASQGIDASIDVRTSFKMRTSSYWRDRRAGHQLQ